MALVSVWPSLWFVWFGAIAIAIFGGRERKDVRSKSLMVLAIVGLCLVLLAPAAHAQNVLADAQLHFQKNAGGLTMFRMTLRADWDGNRSTDQFSNVSWTKSYGNGIYHFDHWVWTIDADGRYSYGTRWRMRRITAGARNRASSGTSPRLHVSHRVRLDENQYGRQLLGQVTTACAAVPERRDLERLLLSIREVALSAATSFLPSRDRYITAIRGLTLLTTSTSKTAGDRSRTSVPCWTTPCRPSRNTVQVSPRLNCGLFRGLRRPGWSV